MQNAQWMAKKVIRLCLLLMHICPKTYDFYDTNYDVSNSNIVAEP